MFLGIEPRLLVAVGVGFGARRFDSLAGPLFDDGEDIACVCMCVCVYVYMLVEEEVWGCRVGKVGCRYSMGV